MAGKAVGGPMAGAVATYLCENSNSKHAQRDPRSPDLFVSVTTNSMQYRTPIAVDTFGEVFDYPIVVPIDEIGPSGIEVRVLDQDDDVGSGELIGMVRVSASDLRGARGRTPPLLAVSDGRLERLELNVLPYDGGPKRIRRQFDVTRPPIDLGARVRAGELVRLSAKGTYKVASSDEFVNERGYVDGAKRSYNLKDFGDANHAAAIARIGLPEETHSALVVESCLTTLAHVSGPLFIGINDDDRSNNSGSVAFDVEVSLPTLEEWRSGIARPCR